MGRRRRHPGQQPAAANRDQQHIQRRYIGQELHRRGALSGDHPRVGEGMDISQTVVLGAVQGGGVGGVPDRAMDHHLGAQGAQFIGFRRRRAGRQIDHRRRAAAAAWVTARPWLPPRR